MGLTIKEEKTNFMFLRPREHDVQSFRIGSYTFKGVSRFKYMGIIMINKNEIKVEIGIRILMINRCYFGVKKQLKFQFISMKIKANLC